MQISLTAKPRDAFHSQSRTGTIAWSDCILVLLLPLYSNLYTNIQTKLPFTKALLTKTDEINDASGQYRVNLF